MLEVLRRWAQVPKQDVSCVSANTLGCQEVEPRIVQNCHKEYLDWYSSAVIKDRDCALFYIDLHLRQQQIRLCFLHCFLHLDRIHRIIALLVVSCINEDLVEDFEETWVVSDAAIDLRKNVWEKCLLKGRVWVRVSRIICTIFSSSESYTHICSVVCSTDPMYVSGRNRMCSNCDEEWLT